MAACPYLLETKRNSHNLAAPDSPVSWHSVLQTPTLQLSSLQLTWHRRMLMPPWKSRILNTPLHCIRQGLDRGGTLVGHGHGKLRIELSEAALERTVGWVMKLLAASVGHSSAWNYRHCHEWSDAKFLS